MTQTAIDLFAGAGGATQGLRDAGYEMLAAVEIERDAAESYRANHPDVVLVQDDVRAVDAGTLRAGLRIAPGELTLLKACPPCQGFSSLASGAVDEARNDLVLDVVRFVKEFLPTVVLLENVPGLGKDPRLRIVREQMADLGYESRAYVVQASDFGVPQRRRRLIVIALRNGLGSLPDDLLEAARATADLSPSTAGAVLAELDALPWSEDPLDRHRRSRGRVQARIEAVPEGGTRFDLPVELQLECHKAIDARGARNATASYGRVRAPEPAPTMTTRCTTPACGAFIHPTLHRGITLREAAMFQTFPRRYKFVGHYDSVERQIGNAVPVRLAQILGGITASIARR